MKERKRRALTSITALGCAAAVLVAGTFAWQAVSSARNEFSNEKVDDIKNPGGNLHDDFNPETGDKDIYVENTGDTSIYVRVKLEEYIRKDATIAEDGHSWTTHIPASGQVADCDNGFHGAYEDAFQWTMGNESAQEYKSIVGANDGKSGWTEITEDMDAAQVAAARKANDQLVADAYGKAKPGSTIVNMENAETAQKKTSTAEVITMKVYAAKSDAQKAAFTGWVYDEDGYAYWSQPLNPGTATGLLLDSVSLPENETYFYAINATMEYVDREDLGAWTGPGTDGVRKITTNEKDQMTSSVNDKGNEIKSGSRPGQTSIEASVDAKDMLNELSGSNLEAAGATTTLPVGDKAPAPTVIDGEGNEVTVTWESSDSETLAVDPKTGEITGVKEGTATVTGTDENGNSVDYNVTVTSNDRVLTPIDAPKNMDKGDVADAPKVEDAEGNEVSIVDWTSSNPDVVSVDPETGELTANKPGTSTITGEDEHGNKVEFVVTVKDELNASPSAVTVGVGEDKSAPTLTDIKGNPVNPSDLTWKSGDTSKVTVAADGTITGVAPTEAGKPIKVTGTDANGTKVEISVTVTAADKTPEEKLAEAVIEKYSALENMTEGCTIADNQNYGIIPYFTEEPLNGSQDFGTLSDNYGVIPLSKFLTESEYASNVTFTSTDAKVIKIEDGNVYLWYLPTYAEFLEGGMNAGYHPEAKVIATYTDPVTGEKASQDISVRMCYRGTIMYDPK